MMAETQDATYFSRMASSLGDKAKLLDRLEGFNVLDVGAGGGELAHAIRSTGRRAFALDGSFVAAQRMREKYGHDLTVLHGFAHEVPHMLPENYLDTIVCSSLFHEVYSYGTPDTGPYSIDALSLTLTALSSVLKPGGVFLLRDGIMPADWDKEVRMRLDENGQEFLTTYQANAPFASWQGTGPRSLRYVRGEDGSVKCNLESAMEFLYTYTWGWESAPREMKELYGIFTQDAYCEFFNDHGFEVEASGEYVQPGYYHNLKTKAQLLTLEGDPHPLPASNFFLQARKR